VSEANSSREETVPAIQRYDLASGALWNMGGFGLGQFLRLLSNVILTRLLLQEAFGIMALTMVMITSVATLSDLGIRASVVQNPDAEDRDFLNTAWTMNIVRAAILFSVVCAVAFPFADFYETPEIKYLVPMVGIRILIDAATTTKLIVYRRHVKIKQLALIDIGGQVGGLLVMVPLAWYFEAVWTLVMAGLVQSSFRTIMSYVLPGQNNRLCWDRSAVRKIYHFGRWIFLSTALMFADTSADRLVFGKLVSLAMLGVYNIGAMMASIGGKVVGVLSHSLFFPVLSRVHEENGEIATEYNLIRRPVVLFAGWTSAILISSGAALMHTLYDERYAASGWIVQFLAGGLWFSSLSQMNHTALLAVGDSRWCAALNAYKLFGLAVFIPTGWLLWEFPGAVAAISAAEIIRYSASIIAMKKHGVPVWRIDFRYTAFVIATTGGGLFLAGWLQDLSWATPLIFIVTASAVSVAWAPELIPAALQFYRRQQAERAGASPV
jgi:O-antigen/teichoic acid export membrane protein